MNRFLVVALLPLLLLGGCATSRAVGPQMSDEEYLSATEEVQRDYVSGVGGTKTILAPKKEAEFQDGRPVFYGDGATSYTKQLVELPGKYNAVAVYPGHNPEGLSGAVHQGMFLGLAYKAGDKDGDGNERKNGDLVYMKYADGVIRPVPLLSNVQATEDFSAAMLKAVGGGFANGGLSAIIGKLLPCSGCADAVPAVINNVQGGFGVGIGGEAASFAAADANAKANTASSATSGNSLPKVNLY
ncbi:hypothetical protein H6784_02710 [Candidatus Nomurabacteria bacterium]|nr:hypothetical protein [Candidatus Nomurabacteria bacterium]